MMIRAGVRNLVYMWTSSFPQLCIGIIGEGWIQSASEIIKYHLLEHYLILFL